MSYVQQYLFARSINMNSISSTYLCNITDHQLCVINLNGLPFSYDTECLLPINTFLQTSKLSFFGPIIKCGYDYNDNNRYQNGSTFNPCVMFLFFWFICNYDIMYVLMYLWYNAKTRNSIYHWKQWRVLTIFSFFFRRLVERQKQRYYCS